MKINNMPVTKPELLLKMKKRIEHIEEELTRLNSYVFLLEGEK